MKLKNNRKSKFESMFKNEIVRNNWLNSYLADLRESKDVADEEVIRVLVVEDDFSQYCVVEELLLLINDQVEIEWVADADKAIIKLIDAEQTEKPFNMVISDIDLGEETSGMEVFSFCLESMPQVEPVMVSAFSRAQLRERHFNDSEPLHYIKKPINYSDFYMKINPLLKAS
ncbi:MAG: hypothetical protein CME65_01825 [Halobacteriovoraceae bacterium]|nr:hypothetical protein [Halobacteriovoraceae bacterium]|tara:strand:+ start:556 stop:1071 length:516 start_codon:yes stop_codon:yes gene_type:complete